MAEPELTAGVADERIQQLVAEAVAAMTPAQGEPKAATNGSTPALAEINLDSILDTVDLSPQPVRLLGRVYQVRRDMAQADCTRYWKMIDEGKDLEAFGMLIGDEDAAALNAAVDDLPQPKVNRLLHEIMEVAGVMVLGRPVGKLPAS